MTRNTPDAMGHYQSARRLVLGILVLAVGLLLVFAVSLQSAYVHEEIETWGIVLMLLGIGGRLWSTLYIGGRKSAEVVSSGPYSITRNPLYFFSMIAAGGAGAQTGSITVALFFAVACAIAFHVVIRREEAYLGAALGQPYLDYAARVPRFFPNPAIYRDLATVTFNPVFLRRTLVDGLVFFVSIPFFELVEWAHEAGLLPTLFRLY